MKVSRPGGRTQRERVLAYLRRAAPAGVPATWFLRPDDGSAPVLRVASRISELRTEGHVIDTTRLKNGTALYTLRAEAGGQRSAPATGGPQEPLQRRMLDAEPRPLSPYDRSVA